MTKEKNLSILYSFVKTYITVFLALYLAYFEIQGEHTISLWDLTAIGFSAKWAFIAVLRNIYKLLTEK